MRIIKTTYIDGVKFNEVHPSRVYNMQDVKSNKLPRALTLVM
jgi:hypothetical protein